MPRTALTVVTTAEFAGGVADVGFEAADQPNGNSIVADQSTIILVANASGGNVVVSILKNASDRAYGETTATTLTVAAGDTGTMGPFPNSVFRDSSDNTIPIDFDTGTSITIAAVKLTAPSR